MTRMRSPHNGRHPWLAWLVGLCALLLYITTSAPGIAELFDDSLEFQVVGPTFGIAHPTGYPLYTIISGIWSRLLFPIGNWAWRVNILSALFGAITVGLVFRLGQRLIRWSGGRPNSLAALAAAIAFALSPIWWQQATIAEVYTLHGLFVAALLSITVGLNKTLLDIALPAEAPNTQQKHRFQPITGLPLFERRMALLFFTMGLSLTHHRTTVLLLPAVALYILWTVPGVWRPRPTWLLWLGLLFLPLLLYLYLPLRAAAGVRDLHGSYANTWQGFLDHVLARGYLSFFATNTLSANRDWTDWIRVGVQQFGFLGVLLGCLGLAWLVDRHRRPAPAWILIYLTGVITILFAYIYRVPDAEVFLIPAFLCTAIFIGGGVGLCGRILAGRPKMAYGLQLVLMLGLILGPGILRLGGRTPNLINRSHDSDAHAYAHLMASVAFPPGSYVVGLEGEITALRYMQYATDLARDVTGIAVDDPDARLEHIQALMQSGAPTYVTRELTGLDTLYSFSGHGPLVRLWPRGDVNIPQPPMVLNTEIVEGAMQLEGYDLQLLDVPPRAHYLKLSLFWRPTTEISEVLKVSLRPLNDEGQPILDASGMPLVLDQYPLRRVALTTTWLPDIRVRDVHYVPVTQPENVAQLLFIVYDEASATERARFILPVPHAP